MRGMRVLGIDPGSEITGWGVVEGDGAEMVERAGLQIGHHPAEGQRGDATACDHRRRLLAVGDGLAVFEVGHGVGA